MRKYRVVSGFKVLGNEPGSEFEAKLKPDQEKSLIRQGHLEVVVDPPKEPKTTQKKKEVDLDG